MAKTKRKELSGKSKYQKAQSLGQNCKLCKEYRKLGINNTFRCCKRCRTVEVKLKNIKPMIAEIKSMLNKHKRLKKSDVRYQKEEKVVTDVQVEGMYNSLSSKFSV